ncbi:MAG: glycosyltransferase [Sphingomonas sp.]|nr:glycosyltransferase [Sphingomonas sp.]
MSQFSTADAGFVVIGRNEGARLALCIASVMRATDKIIYVDSGSTDDSLDLVRSKGIRTIELNPSQPFTAARARNAGAAWLEENYPGLAFIHFIDGDCELVDGWLARAIEQMEAESDLGVVCGRRRERNPNASPYNRLCDFEWNTPIGVADTCGGDALFRASAFRAAGGFSAELIAGEEPDLCQRVRAAGWRIRRMDQEMTVHDAGMTRFAQWWQRNRRSGYATAEALTRRGAKNPRIWREVLSNVLWALPVAWPFWPLLWLRICARKGPFVASYLTLGKLPHLQGQVDYWRSRRVLIEYK